MPDHDRNPFKSTKDFQHIIPVSTPTEMTIEPKLEAAFRKATETSSDLQPKSNESILDSDSDIRRLQAGVWTIVTTNSSEKLFCGKIIEILRTY